MIRILSFPLLLLFSKSKYYQKPISKEWEGNIMAMPSGEGSVNLRN